MSVCTRARKSAWRPVWSTKTTLFILGLLTLAIDAAAQQPPSPPPPEFGIGTSFDAAANPFIPGDEHSALGRTYMVLKGNQEIAFVPRSSLTAGYNNLPNGMPLTDRQFWPPQLDSGKTIFPGSSAPVGPAVVAPNGDGRVHYDPYSPCGDGVGRWIVIERANLIFPSETHSAVLVAISTGEDPNPADSGAGWTFFAIASTAPESYPLAPITQVYADLPRVGFNTNWISVLADAFFQNRGGDYTVPIEFVFARQTSECSAALPTNPALLPVTSGSGITCSGTSGASTTAWYCNDPSSSDACPAVNYHAPNQDQDGNDLYLVKSNGLNGLNVFQISGSVGSPVYGANTSITTAGKPGPGGGWVWSSLLPNLTQAGTSEQIVPSFADDRITSCVDRVYSQYESVLYAAHTINTGAPPRTEVQWWRMPHNPDATTGLFLSDLERIGGSAQPCDGGLCFDTVDPSIAVNAAGDLVIGYSGVPDPNYAGSGYLGAFYSFRSHSGCAEDAFYYYSGGLGPYFPNGDGMGHLARTGDYSQTVVDPIDDMGFLTTAGWAGAPLPTPTGSATPLAGYGWQQKWAYVPAANPSPAHFVGHLNGEDECPATETNCKLTLTAPPNSQLGDVFFAVVTGGTNKPETLVVPTGWTPLTISTTVDEPPSGEDFFTAEQVTSTCSVFVDTYVLAHVFTGATDPGSYLFKMPRVVQKCSTNNGTFKLYPELGGDLVSYRSACANLQNTEGDYIYPNVNGFPQSSNTGTTITVTPPPTSFQGVGFFPAGDNTTALIVGYGSGESDDSSNGACSTLSGLSGTPNLTTEFLGSGCISLPVFIGDYSPVQPNQVLGPYSILDSLAGPKTSVSITIPPY